MILFLYSNRAYEYQAISCIRSLEPRIPKDMKIVYFTIGFISNVSAKNLIKIPIPERNYPSFHYYKAELSLEIMDMFPNETHFFFTDTDVLFSSKVNFDKLIHDHTYPLGVVGPHEYPYIWENINNKMVTYNETVLMNYLNVPHRTINYQMSCFYVFNKNSYEFFEEYTSICKNQYLLKRRKHYFPFQDETAFNVCLWKREATQTLGRVFVNTHLFETVKLVEENRITSTRLGTNIDLLGADWEYVENSDNVILYHGFKEEITTQKTLNYLLTKQ